uniref:ATP synthase complex subunit 8 n=1 Tax=Nealotus tripes TaxID=372800 RepID=T2HUQ5_9SCOM|nr:ATP synthase F0 subunit 8 [Nealotus tripes]WMY89971.1 ATP synthase F0 subunit 8 [Nealotus tripes]WNH17178.1 ATP synthase F0 subunit 8 [Nealotus tripes]BAN83715.1 ATPase subunit 8 [Nealotus tripes]
MPQLNPAPWLAIMAFSWLVLLTVIPPKILAHTYPKEPTPQSTEKPKGDSWAWPWQ